ncbi:MAG: hypothetical protein AAGB12_16180 [Pseudomonadota bacterium]
MMVSSVIDQNRTDLTYNFTVANFHTYYVTQRNVLVHNCGEKTSKNNTERGNKEVRRKPSSLGQHKGSDALRRENKVARDAAKKAKLNKDQQKKLHDEIVDIAKDIKEGKF